MAERRKFSIDRLREIGNHPICQVRPAGLPSCCAITLDVKDDKDSTTVEKEIVLCPPRKSFPSAQENKHYNKNDVFNVITGKPRWDFALGGKMNSVVADRDKATSTSNQTSTPPRQMRHQPPPASTQGRFHRDNDSRPGTKMTHWHDQRNFDRDDAPNWSSGPRSRDFVDDAYQYSTGDPVRDKQIAKERDDQMKAASKSSLERDKWGEETGGGRGHTRDQTPLNAENERAGEKHESDPASFETNDVDFWFGKTNVNMLLECSGSPMAPTQRPANTDCVVFVERLTNELTSPEEIVSNAAVTLASDIEAAASKTVAHSRFSSWFSLTEDGLPSHNPTAAIGMARSGGPVTMSDLKSITTLSNGPHSASSTAFPSPSHPVDKISMKADDYSSQNEQLHWNISQLPTASGMTRPLFAPKVAPPLLPHSVLQLPLDGPSSSPFPVQRMPNTAMMPNPPPSQASTLPCNPLSMSINQSASSNVNTQMQQQVNLPMSLPNDHVLTQASPQAQYQQHLQQFMQHHVMNPHAYSLQQQTTPQTQPYMPYQQSSSIPLHPYAPQQQHSWAQFQQQTIPSMKPPQSPPMGYAASKGYIVDQRLIQPLPVHSQQSVQNFRYTTPKQDETNMPFIHPPRNLYAPETAFSHPNQAQAVRADAASGVKPDIGFDLSTLMHLVSGHVPAPTPDVKVPSSGKMLTAEDFEKQINPGNYNTRS